MENSTSLRFLEASGRPSGTGRPSLSPPRTEHERPEGGRKSERVADERTNEVRGPRRKQRSHDAAPSQEQEPFEQVLDEAQDVPAAQPDGPATSQPAASAAPTPKAAKAKKAAAPEPSADPLQATPASVPEAPVKVLATSAPSPQSGEPKRTGPHADALPLPATTATVAATDAVSMPEDASAAQPVPAASEPAPAQVPARDSTLANQPLPAVALESRIEPAAPQEPKTLPAPPQPPAESEHAGEILRQMRVQFSPELRTATIQLSPPELGRVSIRIRVEGGELHALVRAEKRETLDALQRHVPELKATLEQLGIQARQFDLQLGFEQHGARHGSHEQQPKNDGARAHEQDLQVREHQRRLARTLSAHAGGIDTYA